MGRFHSREGLHFERRANGAVAVTVEVSGTDSTGRAFSWPREFILLDADTWASVVAAVSARGDTTETFKEAITLHQASVTVIPIDLRSH